MRKSSPTASTARPGCRRWPMLAISPTSTSPTLWPAQSWHILPDHVLFEARLGGCVGGSDRYCPARWGFCEVEADDNPFDERFAGGGGADDGDDPAGIGPGDGCAARGRGLQRYGHAAGQDRDG